MSRIIQSARIHQGIRAITGSMFSTSSNSAAAAAATNASLPEIPSSKSMKELAQGAMYGMVPTKGRYATYVFKEQKRVLHWKWWNPDSPVHQATKTEDTLMYSLLVVITLLSVVKHMYSSAMKSSKIKYRKTE
ncbi:uncharacterized protein LOC110440560 [Mizuhopecten yessoensis]|nr:uncharacterized protein LOC110440560 [Mizuhopecten yessoensis]